jgi:succinoglycan biosynthesis transport protein ExoP
MTEMVEEQSSGGLDLQRYLSIAQRRHLQFLIPAFLGWLLVWGASWVLPASYKSQTLILVDAPTMPKTYIEPNVVDDFQARLQSIKQQVLSRTRLLLIVDKFHLYAGDRRLTSDDKVARMGKDIDIELVQDPNSVQINGFKISFSSHDPHTAQEVASELAGLFINENGKVRLQESEDTTKFLESQLENARARLIEQEAKVRAFQSTHEGALPTQQTSNLQILAGFQQQLQNEQDALNSAKQQRSYDQTLIEQYQSVHVTSRTAEGAPVGLPALDQQLDTLRSKLADLSSRYTDNYPDVQSLKDQIARTEKMRDALAKELKAKSASSQKANAAAADSEDLTTNSPLLQLKGQLRESELEIANREGAVAALKAKINDYQTRLNEEPANDQELTELNRGYDQSKTDYDELVKKKNDSQMATSAEQMQQGERFTVLDPASLPQKPDFPNRLKFCGIGLGAGIGLGLAVVLGLEFLDDRLHSEKEIKNLLPMPVISEIPAVLSPADERTIRGKMVVRWAATAVVIAIILAGSAFSFLRS